VQALTKCSGQIGLHLHAARFAGIGVADANESLIALGVERIGVGDGFKAGDGGAVFSRVS